MTDFDSPRISSRTNEPIGEIELTQITGTELDQRTARELILHPPEIDAIQTIDQAAKSSSERQCSFNKCNFRGNNDSLITHFMDKHNREGGVGIVCKIISFLILCLVFSVVVLLLKTIQEKEKNNKDLEDHIVKLANIWVYEEHVKDFLNNKLSYMDHMQREKKEKISRIMPDYLCKSDLLIQTKAKLSMCKNAKEKVTGSLHRCRLKVQEFEHSENNSFYFKKEKLLYYGRIQSANDILYSENVKLKSNIKMLKNHNSELKSINNYLNIKQIKEISQLNTEQSILKYFVQQLMQIIKILNEENVFFRIKYKEGKLATTIIISQIIRNEAKSAFKIQNLTKYTDSLNNKILRLQIINDLFRSKLQSKRILIPESKEKSLIMRNSQLENKIAIILLKNNDLIIAFDNLQMMYTFLQDKGSEYSFPHPESKEKSLTMKNSQLENKIYTIYNKTYNLFAAYSELKILRIKYIILQYENSQYYYPQKRPPLLRFITVDNSNDEFQGYMFNVTQNKYVSCGSSMSTFGGQPRRGEKNSRGIYVLPDRDSSNIGFYDLAPHGRPPEIRSQSGYGHWGSCCFLNEDTVLCATRSTGDIYKYDLKNNYLQHKIANNPANTENCLETILVTKDKHILASFRGCIYIYSSSGSYLGKSNSYQTYSINQMKEIRTNVILTAEGDYVYSHNIANPTRTIAKNLLDNSDTQKVYRAIEGLKGNTGKIALGGMAYTSKSNYYGYVELFQLSGDNGSLQSIDSKRLDDMCEIQIIREIMTGMLIFGGNSKCPKICTWEYDACPYQEPICYSLGGRDIRDIIY